MNWNDVIQCSFLNVNLTLHRKNTYKFLCSFKQLTFAACKLKHWFIGSFLTSYNNIALKDMQALVDVLKHCNTMFIPDYSINIASKEHMRNFEQGTFDACKHKHWLMCSPYALYGIDKHCIPYQLKTLHFIPGQKLQCQYTHIVMWNLVLHWKQLYCIANHCST